MRSPGGVPSSSVPPSENGTFPTRRVPCTGLGTGAPRRATECGCAWAWRAREGQDRAGDTATQGGSGGSAGFGGQCCCFSAAETRLDVRLGRRRGAGVSCGVRDRARCGAAMVCCAVRRTQRHLLCARKRGRWDAWTLTARQSGPVMGPGGLILGDYIDC